ncbi:MAG TPA: AAA family ATPase [Longimicrobium sp.]|nr:AAA family ATPase [Longimicrobium sp.]
MTIPLIRRLTLQNFLSYGPDGVSVDLLPLNVLIGPNASGKSNLLEALAVLRGAARDLQTALREGGGSLEYPWKGDGREDVCFIEAVIDPVDPSWSYHPAMVDLQSIRYSLLLRLVGSRFLVGNESVGAIIDDEDVGPLQERVYELTGHVGTSFPWSQRQTRGNGGTEIKNLQLTESILTQLRDPIQYPELASLSDHFGGIALFQDWSFGRRTLVRQPQPTDLPTEFLLSDASNLGLILHDLSQTSAKREEMISYLRKFYEQARYISTKVQGGTIQLFIEEEGGRLVPATRLSDGTLRYLCLLAILLHPNPPPLIGIEEPELGLHPDVVPTIAELLKKASERTQLFVTTHSDVLVSALSDTPESILVCESMPSGTNVERLDAGRLREWLKEYSLGEIWRMGEIGGNRW